MNYTKVICQVCGKSFDVMSWKLGQGRGKTCSKECRHKFQKIVISGEKSVWWKGGFYISPEGYKYIRNKNHPFSKGNGYVAEHRLIMEKHIGRYLNPEEAVHHLNGNKLDNRIDNLKLMQNNSNHMKEHGKNKILSCICGKPSKIKGLCVTHYNQFWEYKSFHKINFVKGTRTSRK